MGLAEAQAFYDMTNAVANADVRWLTAQEMRVRVTEAEAGKAASPASGPGIAYLDLDPRFP